jgi:hypothetical protein
MHSPRFAIAALALGACLSFASATLSAPSSAANENRKAGEAQANPPQSGRTEPSATNAADAHRSSTQRQPGPVFVDGALDVPGAPQDSQTRPAKFSKRNDMLDKVAIMARPLGLSEEQKQNIAAAIRRANPQIASITAKPAEELPWNVTMHALPVGTDPRLAGLKYVRLADRILLVAPENRIVVGEIPAQPSR